LHSQIHVHNDENTVDYQFKDGLLYNMDKICVLKGENLELNREAHTSKVVGHFGVRNIISNI